MEDKVQEILEQKKDKVRKELQTMNGVQLHELFLFFYQLNYKQCCMITPDRFTEFLESFDSNPFKIQENKEARKQLIENLLDYTDDLMSLLTAAILIKNDYTIDEIVRNYYASIDVFGQDYYF